MGSVGQIFSINSSSQCNILATNHILRILSSENITISNTLNLNVEMNHSCRHFWKKIYF